MKLISVFIFFLFTTANPGLEDVRQDYIDAAQSEQRAYDFHTSLSRIEDHSDATLTAYKAASIVLLAKYEKGLIAKTRLFNKGTGLLEATITKAPDNYEARLIRLNIQDNVPWITGYTGDIDIDKAFLIKNYKKQPAGLKEFTKKYILQSDAFSEREKTLFD